MALCVNCKEHKKKAAIKVGVTLDVTPVNDACKLALKNADILDYATGKRYIPSVDPVLCRNINAAGDCSNYDEKGGSLATPEEEIEIQDLPD
jgi:hypothetical protein